MDSDLHIYRRRLPHWRYDGAIYFVTWRVDQGATELDSSERAEVAAAIRHFAGVRYRLLAFVVMNDHVHVLVEPAAPHPLERLVQSWKSFASNRLQTSGRRGRIWQPEYFDRIVRDVAELREKLQYVATNPAKRWPGVEDYPWVWCDPNALE